MVVCVSPLVSVGAALDAYIGRLGMEFVLFVLYGVLPGALYVQ